MERWKGILLFLAGLALFLTVAYLEEPSDYEAVQIKPIEQVYWETAR